MIIIDYSSSLVNCPYQTSLRPDFLSHLPTSWHKTRTVSDRRMKKDIKPLQRSLRDLLSPQVCQIWTTKKGPPNLANFGTTLVNSYQHLPASTSIYQHLPASIDFGFVQWFFFLQTIVQASEPAATVAPAGAPKAGRWTKKHGKKRRNSTVW